MKAAIDRIDEGIAVLIPREDDALRLRVPVILLPAGCREGDIITVTFGRDDDATAAARARTGDLVRKLAGR
jgi:hypothetical protein